MSNTDEYIGGTVKWGTNLYYKECVLRFIFHLRSLLVFSELLLLSEVRNFIFKHSYKLA